MRVKLRPVLAVLCAGIAVVASIAYADAARAQVIRERDAALERYGGELVTLIVSSTTLETGDIVSHSNVSEREWISDLAPDAAIMNIDDVLGKTISMPLAQGAPLTELNFRDEQHALDVPSGHVALAVPLTDKLGVSQAMSVGSRILAYDTTAQSATVLASDVTILGLPEAQNSLAQASVITLSVLPQDVQAILVASSNGSLRLLMPADDVERISDAAPPSADSKDSQMTAERVEPVPVGDASVEITNHEKGQAE